MRSLVRPRLYEIVLLADVAVVILLVQTRARIGLDVAGSLLALRGFVFFLAPFLLGGVLVRALLAARRGRRRDTAR